MLSYLDGIQPLTTSYEDGQENQARRPFHEYAAASIRACRFCVFGRAHRGFVVRELVEALTPNATLNVSGVTRFGRTSFIRYF